MFRKNQKFVKLEKNPILKKGAFGKTMYFLKTPPLIELLTRVYFMEYQE
jgi:hypothetical protein